MVSFTDLVSRLHRGRHDTAKIKFQTPRKNSSTIPGSWMVFGHCGMILGQGGVVWVTLSGREDSGDLFESWAAIMETPGAEHRLPGQIVGKWFWERKNLQSENLCYSRFGLIVRSLHPGNPLGCVLLSATRQEVPGAHTKHPGMIHHREESSKCSQVEISKMNKF